MNEELGRNVKTIFCDISASVEDLNYSMKELNSLLKVYADKNQHLLTEWQ